MCTAIGKDTDYANREPRGVCYRLRKLNLGLWSNLEEWEGVRYEREVMYVRIPMADPCIMAETSIIL